MKYKDAKIIIELLNKMSLLEINIPISTAIKILKNRTALVNAVQSYAELENSVFKTYSNGKAEITPNDEEWIVCNQKTQEILNSDVDVQLDSIKINELDGLNLPMSAITALYPMLEVSE